MAIEAVCDRVEEFNAIGELIGEWQERAAPAALPGAAMAVRGKATRTTPSIHNTTF